MLLDEEEAKAIQEAAKTTGKAIDVVKASGGFLRSVFGSLVEDTVGLVADRVKFYRAVNLISLQEKVSKICEEKGITEIRPLSPKFALPLIEAATMEDDQSIQDMYANLMANALDPSFNKNVAPSFVSVLKEFTPFDALFFSKLYSYCRMHKKGAVDLRNLEWRRHLGIDDEGDYEDLLEQNKLNNLYPVTDKENFTIDNLERLGCARRSDMRYMPFAETTFFGSTLYDACVKEID